MRSISLLIAGTLLASCTTAPPPMPTRTAKSEQQFQQLLAGKVAQAPINCLPSYNANDMIVIDEDTVAFRVGADRVYLAHMQGGCTNLRPNGPYALLTRQFGGSGLCRGDIAQVIDPLNHMTVGSCAFSEFAPYVRAGR
jgi:hypothetical protein